MKLTFSVFLAVGNAFDRFDDYIGFGASIDAISLPSCRVSISKDKFYRGMIMNFHRHGIIEQKLRKTDVSNTAEILIDGDVTARYIGLDPTVIHDEYWNGDYFTLQYLDFGQDIRDTNFTITISAACGVPHLYFPLLFDEDSPAGRASRSFMVHIFPLPDILPSIDDLYYANGVYWFSKYDYFNRRFCRGLETLSLNLNDFIADLSDFIPRENKIKIQYSDVDDGPRLLPEMGLTQLQSVTPGSFGEDLCDDTEPASDWMDIQTFLESLRKVLTWFD